MSTSNNRKKEKLLAQKHRGRKIFYLRIHSGIKELVTKPWKCIPVLFLLAAFCYVWDKRNTLYPFFYKYQLLTNIFRYTIALFIPTLFLLILFALLYTLGIPFKSKTTENILLQIGLYNCYGFAPALISHKRIKNTNVSVMEFLSLGVGKERWEEEIAEVQDALNVSLVEDIKYGGKHSNNRNRIVLTVVSGASNITRKDALYDDEL